MRVSEAFPSRYLSAADLKGRSVPVTISNYAIEDVGGEDKPVIYFEGMKKALVLNVTNARTIELLTGIDDMDNWAGHKIVLYQEMVSFKGKVGPAIRVKQAPNSGSKISSGPLPKKPPPRHSDEVESENPAADMDDAIEF